MYIFLTGIVILKQVMKIGEVDKEAQTFLMRFVQKIEDVYLFNTIT